MEKLQEGEGVAQIFKDYKLQIICEKNLWKYVVEDHVYDKHDTVATCNKGPYWNFGLVWLPEASFIF